MPLGYSITKGIGVGFVEEMKNVNSTIQNSLPTKFDLKTDVNVEKRLSTPVTSNSGSGSALGGNNYETNNYNFYSTSDSPAEYVRQLRKEKSFLKLVGS